MGSLSFHRPSFCNWEAGEEKPPPWHFLTSIFHLTVSFSFVSSLSTSHNDEHIEIHVHLKNINIL